MTGGCCVRDPRGRNLFTLNLRNTRYDGALAAMWLAPDAEKRAAVGG